MQKRGKDLKSGNIITKVFVLLIIFAFATDALLVYNSPIVGKVLLGLDRKVLLGLDDKYSLGGTINGEMIVNIEPGDRIRNDTVLAIDLKKDGSIVAQNSFEISEFMTINPVLSETQVCGNETTQICGNISQDVCDNSGQSTVQNCTTQTVDSIVPNCTSQTQDVVKETCHDELDENNETISVCSNDTVQEDVNVCVNDTVSTEESVCENITVDNGNCTQQSTENCTTETQNVCNPANDYFYNQPGTYSRNISEFLDYNFSEPGAYTLEFSMPSFAVSTSKEIVVENTSGGFGALESFGTLGQANDSSNNVYKCGSLDSAGTYTLNQSITASGTCISANASNILIDCSGFAITGDGSGAGINASGGNGKVGGTRTVGQNASSNLIVKNCNITNFAVSLIANGGLGGSGSLGGKSGGNGGTITLVNSTVSSISSAGGSGYSSMIGAGKGGDGGSLTITNSTVSSISSAGGNGGNGWAGGTPIKGSGGAGGSVIVSNSSVSSIYSAGGNGGNWKGVCGTLSFKISGNGEGTIYDSGAADGSQISWLINFGYSASDYFSLAGSHTIDGFSFSAWESNGDTMTSVDYKISSGNCALGSCGTVYGSGTASVSQAFVNFNPFGYDFDTITASGLSIPVSAGTYYLTLSNAVISNGDPAYWDQNSGTSDNSSYCASGHNFGASGIGNGGDGGSASITGSVINLTGTMNLMKGGGLINGTSGKLTLNYTSFSDLNMNYSLLRLQLINNSAGSIDWSSEIALESANLSSSVRIENNTASVNSSAIPALNVSANITLYGLPTSFIRPSILKDGISCTNCWNFTSLNAGTVAFNVSSWTSYSIGDNYDLVTLNSGWNLISLGLQQNSTDSEINISVSPGWNLIGYSSPSSIGLDSAVFINSSGNVSSWTAATSAGKISPYAAYYDSSSGNKKYKYAASSSLGMDDSSLRKGKGYWIYANQSGNLSLRGVGGSKQGSTYAWSKLRFMNSSGVEMNITDAATAGWIESGGWYWGYDPDAERFLFIPVAEGDYLNTWQGYFIYSHKDNVTLIRQN